MALPLKISFSLDEILNVTIHGESWLYTTDFITDRLRQVRKETMQQELADIVKIYILLNETHRGNVFMIKINFC